MNAQLHTELIGRLRTEGKYSTMMLNTLSHVAKVSGEFEEKRSKISQDKHLSDVGRRAKVAELAKATVKDVLEASKMHRSVLAQVAGGRAELKPKPVASADARGELRRSEIRAYVRGLKPDQRIGAALELAADDEALGALLDASPMLSGLSAEQADHLRKEYTTRHHGPRTAELDGWESDAQVVAAGTEVVLSDLKRLSGLPEIAFAEHTKAIQAEVDKGW